MSEWTEPSEQLPSPYDKILFVTSGGMRAFGTYLPKDEARTLALVTKDDDDFYFQPEHKGSAIPSKNIEYWLKVEPIPDEEVNWYKRKQRGIV